jgi:MscS family membrane protein
MQVVKRAGTSFAFPSRTLYYNRDDGLDQERQREVEEKVEAWAATQSLPFPDLADDVRERITDTLSFPPEGSPGAAREDEKV